jgi:dihydroorotase
MDLFISKGTISEIGKNLKVDKAKVVSSPNLHCSIGWMDIGTHLGDPGFEYRETTDSLCAAASAGGYTAIAPFPTTMPIVQSASEMQYLKNLFDKKLQDLIPIAALSQGKKGKDITEMRDLIANGCRGFTDGLVGQESSGLLLRALQYIQDTDAIVIDFPYSDSLAFNGQIHEGETSLLLGLSGIPEIAESIPLHRTLEIVKYVGTRILIHGVSAIESLSILKKASKSIDKLFTTVPYLNLITTEKDLQDFNANLKALPPIRNKRAARKLLKALKEDQITAIISNHCPLEEEKKMVEFVYAEPGATGLETCYAGLNTHLGEKTMLDLIPKMSIGPRSIFQLDVPILEVGEKANLTLFDPSVNWTYNNPKSLSQNNPFLGTELRGKVIGVINGRKTAIFA